MAVYTIADIDKKVDEKFESTDMDLGESGVARLMHPLRLPDDRKARFKELMASFNDLQKRAKTIERTVAAAQTAREKADEAAGGDEPLLAEQLEAAAVAAEAKAKDAEADSDALEAGMVDVLGDVLRAVLADPALGDELLKVVDKLDRRMALIEVYMEANQTGEASSSPS